MVCTFGGASVSSGISFNLFGFGGPSTEAKSQAAVTENCAFTALGGNIVSGGSGTNTWQFRDAGANGQNVASRAGAGALADVSHTDNLTTGDLFNIAHTDTGTDIATAWAKINVEFSSGHGNYHGSSSLVGVVYDVQNSTRFIPLGGILPVDGDNTDANVVWRSRAYDTFTALQVRCSANARTNDSVFKNRINGGDGTAVCTFGAGVTGLVQSTGLSDAVGAGQDIAASITLVSGVQDLTVNFVLATLKSSTNKSDCWCANLNGVTRTASATANYHPIGGYLESLTDFTEANARIKPGFAGVASNLRCLGTSTYTTDGTLKLIKNGSAVLTTTLNALAGGPLWFENTSDSVSFTDTDELSFEWDEGGTGSFVTYAAGITLAPAAYTIAAASGSYALTGSAATLKSTRLMSAAAGAYALSGSAAALSKGQRMDAASGSYALTGSAAGLRATRTMAAAAGSYSLTGSAASLLAARRMAAESGVYTLSGGAASLNYGPIASQRRPLILLPLGIGRMVHQLSGLAIWKSKHTSDH